MTKRTGPCPDCNERVALTKAGKPYPAHRGSEKCRDRAKRRVEAREVGKPNVIKGGDWDGDCG